MSILLLEIFLPRQKTPIPVVNNEKDNYLIE